MLIAVSTCSALRRVITMFVNDNQGFLGDLGDGVALGVGGDE